MHKASVDIIALFTLQVLLYTKLVLTSLLFYLAGATVHKASGDIKIVSFTFDA